MKTLRVMVLIVVVISFAGCTRIDPNLKISVAKDANPWTHLNLYNDPVNFQFAIVADRSGKIRKGVFDAAVEKLNFLKPEFVMCVGDLIEGYNSDQAELNREWDEFDALVNKLEMPFFYVVGNHDMAYGRNGRWKPTIEIWKKRLGVSYYHFVYRNVLFLCVNTEDTAATTISDAQTEYFKEVLKHNRNVRWTLVFMHKPLCIDEFGDRDKAELKPCRNWTRLESLLANRPYTVFAGHNHKYEKTIRNGKRYYILATTGGVNGGPAKFAENGKINSNPFDHVVWVTMTDKGPAMANLLLEGIWDDDPVRSE